MNLNWLVVLLSIILCGSLGCVVLSAWDHVDNISLEKNQTYFSSEKFYNIILCIACCSAILAMVVVQYY